MGFQQDIRDQTSSIVSDIHHDGRPLQIAFGGLAQGVGMPPFEFYNLTSSFPTSKIFVRDLTQSWYHGSMPEIGRGIDALHDQLCSLLGQLNPRRTVFFGNSMGGYAAVLLGHLVGVDRVVAFSPQTFIDLKNRWKHGDRRWWRRILVARWRWSADPSYFDLYPVLKPEARAEVEIHVARSAELDWIHASRMRDIEGVRIRKYEDTDHGLVTDLRNQGHLRSILLSALDVDQADPDLPHS